MGQDLEIGRGVAGEKNHAVHCIICPLCENIYLEDKQDTGVEGVFISSFGRLSPGYKTKYNKEIISAQ